GGAIPETGDYRVLAEPDDMLVGTVNEDWAVESMAGDIFLLGTHSWQIRRVEAGVVRVRDAGDAAPTIPFWLGEAPARTVELSDEVSALRRRVDRHLSEGDPDGARRWLVDEVGVPADAATMIVDYIAAGRAVLGEVPTQDCLVFERFFDDTGGMQLVVHSPYGGRINRGLALALRKKFCRSFNFELQAAATDDAIVLSLGPHHSFPLDEVPRYVHSRTVRTTLEQAILDSPMFQARWRWNLNRALMVLRFRFGRRNPPPIQRMEADDLMAAVFPQAAACQENVTFPIEIPDHLLVRQTVDDTLHEALDVDGLTALLQRIEAGEVRVHCVDTTEPSVLAHEIITARPYAFLDDEEFQNRRTNAVQLRRGLQVELSTIGALDPEAIARVHEEIVPLPETPDDLHDLLSSLVATRARPAWQPLFDQLVAKGRAQVVPREGGELWCTTEARDDVRLALDEGDDDAVTKMVRGHLEIAGITTVARLAEVTSLPESRVTWALAVLQQHGAALQGRYTPEAQAGAAGERAEGRGERGGGGQGETGEVEASGAGAGGEGAEAARDGGGEAGEVEWVARRLLARMHSYSRRTRRSSVQAATAQDFMRFLLRWQHVAPGTQLSGETGLLSVLEQLQGYDSPAVAWEPELLSRRLRHYDPRWLDRLCHDGEVAWLRLTPRARDDDSPSTTMAPSKATPISLVLRHDLGWLLPGARAGLSVVPPSTGATAEVLEVLRDRGASFATDLVAATRRLPDDIERALWDGMARGLIMCDGFGAIRSRVMPERSGSSDRSSARRGLRMSRLARSARPTAGSAGRWSLVPPVDEEIDGHDLAEAVAEQLLQRWGVVFRDLAVHDGVRLPWRELQWALRRLEDRGLVRGGRFVAGFSGEQYALPEAAEQLDHVRKLPRTGERVVVNATDPLNLVGVIVPGATVPAVRTNQVVYVDGVVPTDADALAPPSPRQGTPTRATSTPTGPRRRPRLPVVADDHPTPSSGPRSSTMERLTREILERAAAPDPTR
ncbi:MAG TPA: hypothetical protein VIL36_16490, partial [Acidimicrobiales bacterium]